jgi:outer membrane protein assembly factor BamB
MRVVRNQNRIARIPALLAGLGLVTALAADHALAVDWPMYGADAARSGVTTEQLTLPLQLAWKYEPMHPPAPAWPEPGRELHRMDFDYAFQPVIAAGIACFGSSADDTVRALDAGSGALKWKFTTGGPVRFAPQISGGKAYVASDDGWLYCLSATAGELVWKFRGAPDVDQIPGNGRMVSRWPLRSGVLVTDGVAYTVAGMWPSQGITVYALDAATGKEIWRNDTSGNMYIDLPHPGASAFTGVAPQGYLLATEDILLVPTGRSVPAAYDRKTGKLLYYSPAATQYCGSSWLTLAEGIFFTQRTIRGPDIDIEIGEAQPRPGHGMGVFSVATGIRELELPDKHRVLVSGGVVYAVGNGEVLAIDLKAWRETKSLQGSTRWSVPHGRAYCLVLAGQVLLLGGQNKLTVVDVAKGVQLCSLDVEGQIRGMVVADGRLVVATSRGALIGFEHREIAVPEKRVKDKPTWKAGLSKTQIDLAAQIIQKTGKSAGYALVVGEADARLAIALASQSDLHVVGVLPGTESVQKERDLLLTTDLYGSRIVVQGVENPDRLPYGPYFADLVVATGRAETLFGKDLYRVLRPCGGVLCFPDLSRDRSRDLVRQVGAMRSEIRSLGNWAAVIRGPLPGAGEWRYPWADGGQTGIGKESRLQMPLDVLWFGGPGPDRMMSRHWGTSTPLSVNGRVFVTGQHHIIAFDAYTGREFWSRPISDVGRKGAIWRSSNFVADDDSVYVTVGTSCHRLSQASGKTLAVYNAPESLAEPPVAAAEPPPSVDVEWPRAWQIFGPFPKEGPLPKQEELSAIPKQLSVDGKAHGPKSLASVNGFLDFSNLFGGYGLLPLREGEQPGPYPRPNAVRDDSTVGKTVYAFASIRCPAAGRLLIGAGADWWMQWFLDGKLIYDTLASGNRSHPYAITNHVFAAEVSPGEHVLCVMVKAGSLSWCLVSAGGTKYEPYLKPESLDMMDAWGYLSVTDSLILGTYETAKPEGPIATSLFALDKADAGIRWVFRSQRNIENTGIAFGDGRLFVLETTPLQEVEQARRRGEAPSVERILTALDLDKGRELWRVSGVPATWNRVQVAKGVVVVNASAAYDARNGQKLWEQRAAPERPPLILGDWIIAQPQAFNLRTGEARMTTDLLTGEERPWKFPRSYGCGSVVGCQDLLFFRSGTYGFFDFAIGGTTNFGGIRPGCSVNVIPANGLVVVPEGCGGCTCSYNFQTSMALVPGPSRGDLWYAFEGERSDRPVRQLRLNLGAPGDRRDSKGIAWLGFPRPTMQRACPVPVAVISDKPGYYYRPSDQAQVKATDSPWLYTSGLRCPAKVLADLVSYYPIVVPACEKPPAIDGELNDPCWQGAEPVPFLNRAHLLEPQTSLFVRRDAHGLYFAYQRKAVVRNNQPLPFLATQTGDNSQCWVDDEFEIFVSDQNRQIGLQFGVSCGGGRFDGLNAIPRQGWSDLNWKGQWTSAAKRGTDAWTAEVAIPFRTLSEAKIDTANLAVNLMSQNLCGQGQRTICLTDPGPGGFGRCQFFLPVVEKLVEPPERSFTVRLHFAELDDLRPGERAFDVAIQGQMALADLDLAKEAGRPGTAVVKEFRGVRASRQLSVELTAKAAEITPANAPVLSALEVIEESEQ